MEAVMSGLRAFLPAARTLLQVAIVLLMFGLSSACKSTTDSGCDYNPDTQECN
jgi:hypothetical protein